MNFITILSAGLGGAIGSICRYLIGFKVNQYHQSSFPFSTFSVNIIGSFLMGFLFILLTEKITASQELKTLILVGFLGGLTTFSSFSLDIGKLIQNNDITNALIYVFGSVIVGFVSFLSGLYLAKVL